VPVDAWVKQTPPSDRWAKLFQGTGVNLVRDPSFENIPIGAASNDDWTLVQPAGAVAVIITGVAPRTGSRHVQLTALYNDTFDLVTQGSISQEVRGLEVGKKYKVSGFYAMAGAGDNNYARMSLDSVGVDLKTNTDTINPPMKLWPEIYAALPALIVQADASMMTLKFESFNLNLDTDQMLIHIEDVVVEELRFINEWVKDGPYTDLWSKV
jgi:hypothetical protein